MCNLYRTNAFVCTIAYMLLCVQQVAFIHVGARVAVMSVCDLMKDAINNV